MKKLTLFIAMAVLLTIYACSKIAENNDPVIGIWSDEAITANTSTKGPSGRQEWIFNDAYLGRYHGYQGNEIQVQTDFKWRKTDEVYVITYPGTDFEEDIVTMEVSEEGIILLAIEGEEVLAVRE
jgi:hypothetical protein